MYKPSKFQFSAKTLITQLRATNLSEILLLHTQPIQYNNQPKMSSNLLLQQSFNSLQQVEIDRGKSDKLKIIHWPVEKIRQIFKIESQILTTFKESLNLQYQAFDFKFNALKQLIEEFRIKTVQDQAEILEMYEVNDNVHVKSSKLKSQVIPQLINNKNGANSLPGSRIEESLGSLQRKNNEKQMAREMKPKIRNKRQNSQHKVEEQPLGQLIQRRIKKPIKYQESDNADESQNQEKADNIRQKIKHKNQRQNFFIESTDPNKYEISRQRLQKMIKEKGKIENHFNKIGQILLHPYSTLQMLLDYNESSDYPLVKAKKQEKFSEDDSD